MKQVLFRFLHVLMAVVVLLSSMGFGLVDQACQMRGKRTYLIHQHSNACAACVAPAVDPVAGPVIRRTACCVEKTRYEKVATGSSFSPLFVKFIKVIGAVAGGRFAPVFAALSGLFVYHSAPAPDAVFDPPALPSGRQLLVLVQSFLI